MTEQEAFETWLDTPHHDGIALCDAWHAALAWLRSQGDPAAWIGQFDGLLYREQADVGDTPLFLAPRAIEGDDREYLSAIAMLGSAMRRLVIAARTSGGTAGPDAELMSACEQAEDAMTIGSIGRAMSDPPPAIPDGYRLVPKEPTTDQKSAGLSACADTELDPSWEELTIVYRAMIAAAPEPTK